MNPIVKILTINLPRLNNAEYTQFMSNVAKLVEIATPAKLGVSSEFFGLFKENIQTLTDISNQSKISDSTKKLEVLDKERDDLAVYLLATFRTERKTPIENKRLAAISLYNATKNYIGLQNLPNRQETQVIEGLIADLEKPEYKAHITTLGLAEVVSALKAKNLEYKELTQDRAENQVANRLESAKKLREQVNLQYDEISTRAFVNSIATPSEETANFVNSINKLIEDTTNAYKQRMGIKTKNASKL